MRILIAHIQYQFAGGEDIVVKMEELLLRGAGHEVLAVVVPSQDFHGMSLMDRTRIAIDMGSHLSGRRRIATNIESFKPDIVHFHNLYPLLGPGAILEAIDRRCATVQTLHNYRLSCLAGTHYRDGAICEKCFPGHYGPGILRGCYRCSCSQGLMLARGVRRQWAMLATNSAPDQTICLTGFMRDRLISAGAPKARLTVKTNSVDDGEPLERHQREGVCYIGRLSIEKGIVELLKAWPGNAPLITVVGDGPLREDVSHVCSNKSNCHYVGPLPAAAVRERLRRAAVMIFPSVCLEGGLPLVVLESLAEGTPVVGYSHGTFEAEMEDSCFIAANSGDVSGLVRCAERVCVMSESEWTRMSANCLSLHQAKYSHLANLMKLESVYRRALKYHDIKSESICVVAGAEDGRK